MLVLGLCWAGACSSGGQSRPSGGTAPPPDADPTLSTLQPTAGGGTPADGALQATELHIPAAAGGSVPLEVTIEGVRQAPVQAAIDVSTDGASFRPATLSGTKATSSGGGGSVAATWDAVQDLGTHAAGAVSLRITPSDGVGQGPAATFTAPVDNLRAAARRVDHYISNYGPWNDASVGAAQHADLVIAHPANAKLTRADVQRLQAGANPSDPHDDVLVLCYVSAGEDLRTHGLSDDQIRADPRFRGDGTGPRIDPRGPDASGHGLDGLDPRGVPSNGGTGFASFYLDDNDVQNSGRHVGDGFPDRNQIFQSFFVNAGDPAWFDVVDQMTMDSPDQLAGLREVLTPDYGRGLNCDGVFLDTIDTAAPNSYTNAQSANESKFEWTAPGFGAFIRRVHQTYPNKLILQNRGVFFFDARHPQYAYNARGAIDFLLFESFRLDSNRGEQWNAIEYPDNRYNVAPKLMAEANRPDGFRVLSLGYAEGPGLSPATLAGVSTLGFDSLMEDIHVTQELNGFRHYLTDGEVRLVNNFVQRNGNLDDHAAPVWSSTYNEHDVTPAVAPTPRVGIQKATGGGGSVTVWWDVALDMNRVSYVLYAQAEPFDFQRDPSLSKATSHLLAPSVPPDYLSGVGPDRYPYQATVGGFAPGQPEYLLIRAVDQSPSANQDSNTVVLTATP
ncbi:MAG TPA: hypothetical protein VN962_18130 [Polyangia bacterium]|nr:hypothetical protein [Polyangia bacterium]